MAHFNYLWLLIHLPALGICTSSAFFQCSYSNVSGFYTPNIPDLYYNLDTIYKLRIGISAKLTAASNYMIYAIPASESEICNGTVTAAQMCYQSRYNGYHNINFGRFNLLTKRSKNFFMVIKSFPLVAHMSARVCVSRKSYIRYICCENMTLSSSNQFNISSLDDFGFGIQNTDWRIKPLRFRDGSVLSQYQKSIVLRLIVGPHAVSATTTAIPETTNFSSNFSMSDMTPPYVALVSSPPPEFQVFNKASKVPIVGGAMGVVLTIAIVVGITIALVLLKWKKSQTSKHTSEDCRSIDNRIYEEEYADIGPTTGTVMFNGKQQPAEAEMDSKVQSVQAKEAEENVYMVPASDEDELYSQLEEMNMHHILRQSVKLGAMLGSGQFGDVYKAELEMSEKKVEVAVKTLKEGVGEEERVKFLQEAAIMGQFNHFNVVTMYGVVTEEEPILLVLEFLTRGDLRQHLIHTREKEGVSIDSHTLLSYCRHVAAGMAYLSEKGFVHRDLAARNVLLSDEDICKIADFGMSRDLMDESYYTSHGGMIPVKWTAPEALHYKKYSTASDVWSYGAVMYEIWSVGHKPFENYTNNKVMSLLEVGYRLAPPPGCPRRLYSTMMDCWHSNQQRRPSFMDICRSLSFPDSILLQKFEEDLPSCHPDAQALGADLECAENLYEDLQWKYMKTKL